MTNELQATTAEQRTLKQFVHKATNLNRDSVKLGALRALVEGGELTFSQIFDWLPDDRTTRGSLSVVLYRLRKDRMVVYDEKYHLYSVDPIADDRVIAWLGGGSSSSEAVVPSSSYPPGVEETPALPTTTEENSVGLEQFFEDHTRSEENDSDRLSSSYLHLNIALTSSEHQINKETEDGTNNEQIARENNYPQDIPAGDSSSSRFPLGKKLSLTEDDRSRIALARAKWQEEAYPSEAQLSIIGQLIAHTYRSNILGWEFESMEKAANAFDVRVDEFKVALDALRLDHRKISTFSFHGRFKIGISWSWMQLLKKGEWRQF